jgi:hypothetical protein
LCNFLHSTVTASLLGPNIIFRTLFSNILSLYSSLSVRDQVSHPHKAEQVLRSIFGPKRNELTCDWGQLRNADLGLYFLLGVWEEINTCKS